MKQRITAAELKAMTMKELAAWVEFNACAINRTMVMSWGHEELFKNYHIRPEYIGWKAGRLIVKTFHFTSRTRKSAAQSFAAWLHWAIFGEYPAEETEETEEAAQQPQEAQQPAPAAEAEQQPTETAEAAQAATQAAEGIEITAITYTTDEDPTPAPGLLIHRPGSARGIIIGDGVMLPDDPTDLLTAYGEREYSRDAAGNYIITDAEPEQTATTAQAARQADPITAAIIDSMTAPAPAHTITVTWANGSRATYSAAMLDLLRTDPAALDIQDDDTGELVYIRP